MIGIRPGEWILKSERSVGETATVYGAEHATDGRRAAVTIFAATKFRPEFSARFAADLLGFQRLNHPNIVKYYDAGVAAGQVWHATELVDGTTAADLLKAAGRKSGLPFAEQVLSLAVQAARAIKHAHHRNLLHRGLCLDNALVMADGTLKLCDFGLTKVLPSEATDGTAGGFPTLAFQPPEHFTGKPYTRRSDLYALGCWLYALTTGRPMFAASSLAEYAQKHCYMLPDRPAMIVPDLPGDFDDLICTLIQKDPNRRPASASQVLDELNQLRAKLERKGVKVNWPADPGDASGPMAALTDDDAGEREPRVRPFTARPAVVLPLFLLVVALGLWFAFRPVPTAAELYAQAKPLIESTDPADWERAWDDFLGPLAERYPQDYTAEVAELRTRLSTRKDIRRIVDQATRARYERESERQFQTGLKLAQAGDVAGARRLWSSLIAVWTGPDDDRWRRAAEGALAETADLAAEPPTSRLAEAAFTQRLQDAVQYKKDGRAAEATALLNLLTELYRDDQPRLERIQAAR